MTRRHWFLVAAILACVIPALVYAAGVTLTYSVTPPAAGIVCDYGPVYNGTVPYAAQKAGFTRCAANYDFTVTGSFNDTKGNHTWSTFSSWLTCSNSNGNPYFWKMTSSAPCLDGVRDQIVTDGNGIQNLQETFTVADSASLNRSIATVGNGKTGNADDPFRSEYYQEFTLNITNANACPGTECGGYESSYFPVAAPSNSCFVGTDMELDTGLPSNQTGMGFGPWNCQNGTGGSYGVGAAKGTIKYNTIQTWGGLVTGNGLQTSDGSAGLFGCALLQDGRIYGLPGSASTGSCAQFPFIIPPDANNYNPYGIIMQSYMCFGNCGGFTGTAISSDIVVHLYRWTLWECPTYDTPGPTGCITNPAVGALP